MKLPPDVDRLAWSVAESHDEKARAEFAHRYPEFAEEMRRRATLVDDRGATPAHAASGIALPVRHSPVPTWATVLAGLAVGAVVLSLFIPRSEASQTPELAQRSLILSSGGADRTTSAVLPVIENSDESASPSRDLPPVSTASPEPAPNNPNAQQNIRLSGTDLRDALALIAAAGELRLQIDPDIADPQVQEEFNNLTPRQMIERLGQEYGFRVVEETPGSLVLVPLDEPQSLGDAPEGASNSDANDTNASNGSDDLNFPVFSAPNR